MLKNLFSRIVTGLIFVSIMLAGIICNQYTYGIVISILMILALIEFYNLLNKTTSLKLNTGMNVIGGVLLFGASFAYCSGILVSPVLFLPYIIYIAGLFIAELYLKNINPIKSLSYSLLGQVYISVPFALLNSLAFSYPESHYHWVYLVALLAFIWIDDSFAYLCGVTLGKHRMFERISPKKSWEGFFGGAMFTIAASFVFSYFFNVLPLAGWIGFALMVIIFGTWGDLIESLMKRTLNVKDSGSLLPGHGGILDRIDSFIFSIPALFIYLQLLKYFT